MKNNLYRIVTGYDGSDNYDHYFVSAENGFIAALWLNSNILTKRRGTIKEVIESVSCIGPIEYQAK